MLTLLIIAMWGTPIPAGPIRAPRAMVRDLRVDEREPWRR